VSASGWFWVALFPTAILIEVLIGRRLGRTLYEGRETEVTLGLAFGWLLGGVATTALAALVVNYAFAHRLADLNHGAWGVLLCVVLADLTYYAWHRLSHRWRWMWATHWVHHTASRLNVLASVRQGWTDAFSGAWLSWAPLGLLGFPFETVGIYFAVLLVVEALIHNEWAGRLGPLEAVLVTPSHHRVHHSLDAAHIDRNFGGVLIVWDRLFGTFQAEGPARISRFGVAGFDPTSHDPLEIATRQWRRIFRRLSPA
jgi:sterol desaturase/sphingolipid hydroxylase (fatty acid hydroxylase superfamily)